MFTFVYVLLFLLQHIFENFVVVR